MNQIISAKKCSRIHFNYLLIVAYILLSLNPLITYSQSHTYLLSNETDSLIGLLSTNLTADNRIKLLSGLNNEQTDIKIKSLKDQLTLVEVDSKFALTLNERLGRTYKWVDKGSVAYQYFTKMLYLAEKYEDKKSIASGCFELANNIRIGNVPERPFEPYLHRAIDLYSKLNDPVSQSNMMYAKLILTTDENKRLSYAYEAIELLEAAYDKSDTLLMESLARHLNVAGIYQQRSQSIKSFNMGLSIANELGDYQLQGLILNNMGDHFLVQEQYDLAIPYHLEALDISIQEGMKNQASNSLNNLSICYQRKGMETEALDYFRCFYYLQSDINSNVYYQNLAELKVNHDFDRVELKNDLLLTEQKLHARQKLALIITSIMLLLIACFIYWSQRKITKSNEKLRALDKVKARFFANISHELRTPITLINGPIQAMINGEYGEISPALANQMGVVRNNGKNLLNLVNEILDLTKLEAGKLQLVQNPSQLYSFLGDLLAAYQSEIKDREIDFYFDYNYSKEASILIDEVKFAKIINNLLSNAFKFTPDQGNITLAVKEVNGNLSVSVKDSGLGIHPEDIEQVFERFYQSSRSDIKASGGTGIGLALSQELAKLHHGSIRVSSEWGKGSEFVFTFPCNQGVPIVTEMVDVALNAATIKTSLYATIDQYKNVFGIEKPVLLLSEDHQEMRTFITSVLRPFYQVIEATNGLQALKILQDHTVDLMISDVMMPKMDGFELLEIIKGDARFRKISMIMLTARAAEEDKLFALTLGVDDYLTKPFSQEELLVRTKNILDNRMVRHLASEGSPVAPESIAEDDATIIVDIKALIEKHIDSNLLSVSFLAAKLSLGERQLLRKIKSSTGFTPMQLIKEIRLLKAKSLLETHQVETVSEAAYQVGFDKVKYFSGLYIERFGKKPSEALSKA
ncbi:MAG: signal transduction histidine kinase/DNA-binding response OmpR family regulator [Paraglaciecola sp.]|jgi:signal transduction histidine kinase/DNA-binding response OmpR family regulator